MLAAHLPRPALADAALTGRRYSGPEAHAVGIVTDVAPEAEVLERAVAVAASVARWLGGVGRRDQVRHGDAKAIEDAPRRRHEVLHERAGVSLADDLDQRLMQLASLPAVG